MSSWVKDGQFNFVLRIFHVWKNWVGFVKQAIKALQPNGTSCSC
jgi:hypothetical protein